jgi:hypothetical protein
MEPTLPDWLGRANSESRLDWQQSLGNLDPK